MSSLRVLRLSVAAVVATALLPLALVFAPPAGAVAVTVTTTTDELNGATGGVSLREAIGQANGTFNVADTITLQAGATYLLDLCDASTITEENANASGDLDHIDNNAGGGLTIEGNGATIEQTCVGERVLDVRFVQPLVLRDLTITGGDADLAGSGDAHGGGLSSNGDVLVEDSVFTANQADGFGSAIYNPGSGGVVTMRRSELSDNGPGLGGAVRVFEEAIAEDSLVADNTGAGIYSLNSATVSGSTFSGNDTGVEATNGTLTIDDSTLSGNGVAGQPGGAVETSSGDVAITNSTIVDNVASIGAGIHASSNATLDLAFVTFTGNSGNNIHASADPTTLLGVVLDAPLLGSGCVVGTVTAQGSFDAGSSCGLTDDVDRNISSGGDPMLGALADNGGPTLTRRPLDRSRLIDLLSVAQCNEVLDQRGSPRPVDADFDTQSECDAGAVERSQGQPFTDVSPSHPFFQPIGWMGFNGISLGSQPGPTYNPGASVSRQAMAAFLYRFAGSPVGPFPDAGFADVGADSAFFDEISWMVAEEITTGFAGNLFKPSAPVTRQSMSAFMYRLTGSPAGPFPNPGFSDVSPTHPFFDEISWMADLEITTGFDDGTFRPSVAVSRQAMSAFLFRLRQTLT